MEKHFKMAAIACISSGIILHTGMVFVFGLPANASAQGYTYDSCLNNTPSEGECKDCCDCLEDAPSRKNCRDTCMTTDFSENYDYITVSIPSKLGPDGDYSAAIVLGSESACKEYCDEASELACGDRRYCRDACNEAYSDGKSGSGGDNPRPDPGNGSPGSGRADISIEQALSDEAQMKTIAFAGLAFLTGDLCSDTFFPPGKVSDFFGFQYLRDITPNGFGHNTEFAGRISDSVLSILTDAQVQALVDLANTQASQVDAYGYKRFVMMKAFRRLLENDLPTGATGLDKNALMAFAGDLYEIDGEISYARANVLGGIVSELTETQKIELAELLDEFNRLFNDAGDGGTIDPGDWPEAEPVDLSGIAVSDGRVLVSTYATQLFSWYLGSMDGDTYFCPERHGTYFGSFYMKDIPPLTSREAVSIDTNLTADMGTAFMNTLDDSQEYLVSSLVDLQRNALNNIVSKRREIAETLRTFMDGMTVDEDELVALVRQYGEYEGEMVYDYATNFAMVGNTLTADQADSLMGLRLDYYERFPDYQRNPAAYDCNGAWLYASKVEMPVIENTDFLFDAVSESGVADGALNLVSDGFSFAEGPATDVNGNLYFSDIFENRIYMLSTEGILNIFLENSMGVNGLFFDLDGSLLACEGGYGRVIDIDSAGNATPLAELYNGNSFNEPNDLWVAPDGGVYFTDPVYNAIQVQDGEHVYYIPSDRNSVMRVIDNMVRPNGIVGTADGAMLYVTDHGAGKTFRYTINSDGTLSDKQLFASVGGDGMAIDRDGNVYICDNNVLVYDSYGNNIDTIDIPEQPTNVSFGGIDGQTLFITTRHSVYSIKMKTSGVSYPQTVDDTDSTTGNGTDQTDDSSDSTSNGSESETTDSVTSSDNGAGNGGCFITQILF